MATENDLFNLRLEPWQRELSDILLRPGATPVQDTTPSRREQHLAAKEEEEVYLLQVSLNRLRSYALGGSKPNERIVPDPIPLGAVWNLEKRYPRTN